MLYLNNSTGRTIDPEIKITGNPDHVLNVTAQTILKGTAQYLRPRITISGCPPIGMVKKIRK